MSKLLGPMIFIFVWTFVFINILGQTNSVTSLYTLATNPQDWSSLDLIAWFELTATLAGLTTIVIGTFVTRSDTAIFAGVAMVFFSFLRPLGNVFTYLDSQTAIFGEAAPWIATLVVGPVMIACIIIIIEFWGNR